MERIIRLVWVGDWLENLTGAQPENWRWERASLEGVLSGSIGFAEADGLVVNVSGAAAGSQDWLELLRIATNEAEILPIVALIGDASPPAGLARLLENPERPGLDSLLHISEISAAPGKLYEALAHGLRRAGRVENREAVLITHGTDTMAWAFAYLRYALFDLSVNIVLTGSQLPLEGTFSLSDALGNLRTSVYLLNHLVPGRLFMVFNEGRACLLGQREQGEQVGSECFRWPPGGRSGSGMGRFLSRGLVEHCLP